MNQKEPISIVYNKFCPFAQRALLTAIEKNLPATFTKVSLGEKGSFFSNTYHQALGHDPKSDGKVPILIHGDRILTESEPVCWYLAESFSSGSSLIPNDTFERARMRLMIGQQSAAVIELFNKAKSKQITSIEDYREEIRKVLTDMDTTIRGDYMMGENITLADLMIYPWFERWIILQHNFGVSLDGFAKIGRWLAKMGQRRSVIETRKLTSEEYYISRSQKMFSPKL